MSASSTDAATRAEAVAQAVAFLNALGPPERVIEIRCLDVPGSGKPYTASGYFDSPQKAAEAALQWDHKGAAGTYVVLNDIHPGVFARSPNKIVPHPKHATSDNDIQRRRILFLDFDPIRPAGISSTDAEMQAAHDAADCARLWLHQDLGFPDPLGCESGNGFALFYAIDLPNTSNANSLVADCVKAVQARFAESHPTVSIDQTVHNAARIARLPGTTNRKGVSIADRPHRQARVMFRPDVMVPVSVELLRELASCAPKPEQTSGQTHSSNGTYASRLIVERYLSDHGITNRAKDQPTAQGWTVYILTACPFDASHGNRGEVSLVQAPNGAVKFRCMHNSCQGRGWDDFKAKVGKPDPVRHYDPPLTSDTKRATNQDQKSTKAHDVFTLKRYSFRELLQNDFRIDELIPGLLAKHHHAVIAGSMKAMKTTMTTAACVHLASATPLFGKWPIPRRVRVGFISGESGAAAIKETAARQAKAIGYEPGVNDGPFFSFQVPQLDNQTHLDALWRFIEEDELELCYIDPAYLAMAGVGDSAGNLFRVGGLLLGISRIAEKTGCTMGMVHHNKRVGRDDADRPPELWDIAWAGFAEWARQWWLIGRRIPYDADCEGSHRLWFNVGSSCGFSTLAALDIEEGRRSDLGGRRWEVSVSAPSEARAECQGQRQRERDEAKERRHAETLHRSRDQIVKMMQRHPDGAAKTVIRDESGFGGGSAFGAAFASLLTDGMIEPCTIKVKSGKGERDAPGFRLVVGK